MQVRKQISASCRPGLNAALVVFGALASGAVWADEPSPWYVGVTQSLTHDSNVYRLPDGPGDSYSSTGLVGGFDQPIGRQRVHGAANVTYNKYRDQDSQNNTSYGLNAGWDWQTVWNLSGGVNVAANQSLAQLNGNSPVPVASSAGRNLVKTDQFGANLNWGGTGLLSLQSAYTHGRTRYSTATTSASESTSDSGSFGGSYNFGPDLTTGLAFRVTRTKSPDYGSESSDGRNIDLSVNSRLTDKTGVNGRLSYTRQTNSGGAGQTFSGFTGAFSVNYAPTAKLGFNVAYNRDAGTNGTGFNAVNVPGSVAIPNTTLFENSQVTDALSLGASYAATAKIAVNAGYQYRRAKIVGGAAAGSSYDDTLKTATLAATWAIARPWLLSCNLSHENRDVGSTPTYAYSANVVGCAAQLTLR